MTGKHDRAIARRRGTSVAACALGLSLVVTGAQPVAAPQTASQASAQLRTKAQRSGVTYPLIAKTVRYGEKATINWRNDLIGSPEPTAFSIAEKTNPGWNATVSETGQITVEPQIEADLEENDSIFVEATYDDGSKAELNAKVRLAGDPIYLGQSDKIFWTGKAIHAVNIQANNVPIGADLVVADGSQLPEGLTYDPRLFGWIKHIYIKGTPTEAGTFTVTTNVVDRSGKVMQGANGPLEQTFTITVKDSADLPAPVEEDFVADPAPVKPGEKVNIDIPTENASSVEVTDLPDGLTYDGEKSQITGTPKASGKAKVEIITNDAKVITDTIDIQVEGSGDSTTPETTTAEPTTGATTPTSGEATSATPTSGWVTTQPEPTTPTSEEPITTAKPTSGQDTPELTTKPSTPGSSEQTSTTPTSGWVTTQPEPTTPNSEETTATAKPTSGQPTSGQQTSEPSTPATTGKQTSGQGTPEPTTKPSTPGSSEPTTTKPTSGRLTTQPAPTSTTKPTTSAQPTSGEATSAQPTAAKPTTAQPTATKPTTAKPAPSVDDFDWDTLTVQAGTTKVALPSRKPSTTVNVRVDGDAPEWLSVASDGQVVAAPDRDVEPDTYTVDVVSEAGERDTVRVKVTKPVSDADRISGAQYKDTYVRAGKTQSSRRPIASVNRDGIEYKAQPLPAGTKFSTDSPEGTVDPDTGVVTVKAPLRYPVGKTIDIKVDFTYPDGTTGEATAVFHVDAGAQNEMYTPAYQEGLGAQPGKTVVVPLLDGTFPVNKDGENIGQYALAPVYDDKGNELGTAKAYKGWDVSINPDTGEIYAAAPEENPEPIEVPVTVLYADGTVSDEEGKPTVFANIAALTGPSLADSTEAAGYGKPFFDEDGNIRIFPTGAMPPGATFEQTGLTALPVEIDPETGAITVKVSEDAPVGANFDIPLKLTLPDGSVQEITVPVATQSEAASQVVSWRPVQVTDAGTPVTVAPSQAPAGATYALAASFDADGWQASVDPKTGAITAARNGDEEDPQAALIPVVVTFADGSQRVVEVPATTVRGTAALTQVEYPRVTINAGQIAILHPNVTGASFSLIKPIPGLRTKIDPHSGALTVASYDGTVPGPRDIPVQVTFEDSSHTIVSARVDIRTKSGKGTLAESILLSDVSAVGRPDSTTRVTLPDLGKAADQPFSLGEFDAEGWEVSLDHARGVIDVYVPADAAGQVQRIPVNVRFADGSTGQFNVSVDVDGVAAGGSSQGSEGSSKPSPWVWVLAVIGLLGTAGKVLYDNCDKIREFLRQWV